MKTLTMAALAVGWLLTIPLSGQSYFSNAQSYSFFPAHSLDSAESPFAIGFLGGSNGQDLQLSYTFGKRWSLLAQGTNHPLRTIKQRTLTLGIGTHHAVDYSGTLQLSILATYTRGRRNQSTVLPDSGELIERHLFNPDFHQFGIQPTLHLYRGRNTWSFAPRVIGFQDIINGNKVNPTEGEEQAATWKVAYEPGMEWAYQLATSGFFKYSKLLIQGSLTMTAEQSLLPMGKFRVGVMIRPSIKQEIAHNTQNPVFYH